MSRTPKPCPFCGKPAELTENEYGASMVECQWCLARTCSHNEGLAIDKWNSRPGENALRARAEAAEAALATARAEGAAAERAAVLAELRDDLLGCEILPERTEVYVRELIEEIAAGRHVRPVEGA